VIQWAKPDDRSNAILRYKIEIQSSTDSSLWQETIATCDGTNAVIVNARVCTVPMETLLSNSFGYILDQVIKVRVTAQNQNGWGLPSTANTVGATAKTKPIAMIAPTRGEDTTERQVQVVWVT